MSKDEPFLRVFPGNAAIDVIHVSREDGPQLRAWKADGFKGDELCAPDIWYEEFDLFLRHLNQYIVESDDWQNAVTGEDITYFSAIKLLTSDPPKAA
ncbi:hypothetical protein [Paraurantiacibacter namhicola]|uniref:Uncharacterized protein n=1 Tax=Paraurantiacibacter namhicola TaxID=645517 RepID=A0A1C7D6T5_9SPHN|nr:hypothetical protein [Paraurantiacibacter namhicola]ANU07041.1 hypothetical protein A6F65_00720 [Paraurantiacibacter namhicola]